MGRCFYLFHQLKLFHRICKFMFAGGVWLQRESMTLDMVGVLFFAGDLATWKVK